MREILFRGKRTDNGEWVFGDLVHFPDRTKIDTHKNGQPWRGYDVYPDTVGEFTGLTDKNGKRIFEGDIVSVKIGGLKRKGVVFYEDIATRFGLAIGTEKNFSFLGRQMAKTYEAEAIGDIHDNPELLEVDE